MITTFAAFFAFGYGITDIILNYRVNKRIDKFLSKINQPNNFDD